MEVEGNTILEKYCLLCKNHGKDTQANGYCVNCEQYMCNTCFEHHKMLKVARDHSFIDNENGAIGEVTTDNRDELDVCPEHDENIKFYCPSHDVVGCGDCMILGHKPCNVEYVRDKAKVLKSSEDFICFVKELSQCKEKVYDIESVLKNNNEKVNDINNTFVASVNMYKDEIVSHVNKVADEIIMEAANVASENRQGMNDLDRESKALSSDITSVQQIVDAHTDQPSKLFVSFIQQKPKLKCIQKELDEIECKNKIDHYHFEPESDVMSVLTGCSGIGRLQRAKGSNRTSDAERVCSRDLVFQGQEIALDPDRDHTLQIPQPILLNDLDFYTSRFIQRSYKHKSDLESKLQRHYGRVVWPSASSRNNVIQIVCSVDPKDKNGHAKVKDWTEKCLSDVKEITDSLTLERSKKVTEEVSGGQSPGPREAWGPAGPMHPQFRGRPPHLGMDGRGCWQIPPFDFMGRPRGPYPPPYRMGIPQQGPPQPGQKTTLREKTSETE